MVDASLGPGVKQAGDCEIKSLYLIDSKNNNKAYNLIGVAVDITIYESIFSPVLTGYIANIESQNLLSLLPITGGEQIVASFATPGKKPISCVFVVTTIEVHEADDKTSMYSLGLISYEGYVDLNTKISTAYHGNTSDLFKSVCTNIFGKIPVDVDASSNTIKFVSGFWNPFKILNFITARATLPNNKMLTPNYLFYQTTRGHKMKSVTSLLAQAPFMEYVFDKNPARVSFSDDTSVRDIGREYATIKTLNFVAAQDYVKNQMTGAHSHRVFGLNVTNKAIGLSTYSHNDDFSKTSHTDANPLNVFAVSKTSGRLSIRHTFPQLFNNVEDISTEIYAKRVSLMAQLEIWKMNIVVHGRTDIEVGMTMNLWLNNFKEVDSSDKNSADTYDKTYSGKYLITAIQHRFTMAKHEMNMQIIKDSSFSEIKVT